MDSFEDLDAQLEQLQAQLKNDIQKVWFTLFQNELRENFNLKFHRSIWAKSYLVVVRDNSSLSMNTRDLQAYIK